MFQCSNVKSLAFISNNSKNLCKLKYNNGNTKKFAQPTRSMADHVPYKRPTMKEMPVPSGSWSANYASRNKKNNVILLIGTTVFGCTLGFAYQSGHFDVLRGVDIEAFKKAQEAEVSSEEKEERTAAVNEIPAVTTSSPKSIAPAAPSDETSSDSPKSEHPLTPEHLVIITQVENDSAPLSSNQKKSTYLPS